MWKRVALQQLVQVVPGDSPPLGATPEPLAPDADDELAKTADRLGVPRDAEVPEVTSQLLYERLLLLPDRLVLMLPAPRGDPLQRSAETAGRGLALDHPL